VPRRKQVRRGSPSRWDWSCLPARAAQAYFRIPRVRQSGLRLPLVVPSSNETSDGACCRSRRESRRRGRAIGGGCRVIAQTKVEWETPIVDPPRCEVPSHLLRSIGHETNARIALAGEDQGASYPTGRALAHADARSAAGR